LADNRGTGDSLRSPQSLRLSTRRGPCLRGGAGEAAHSQSLNSHPSDECQWDPRSAGTRTVDRLASSTRLHKVFPNAALTYECVEKNTRGKTRSRASDFKDRILEGPPLRPTVRRSVVASPLGSGSPWPITGGLGTHSAHLSPCAYRHAEAPACGGARGKQLTLNL
jgi:hypothetical protein